MSKLLAYPGQLLQKLFGSYVVMLTLGGFIGVSLLAMLLGVGGLVVLRQSDMIMPGVETVGVDIGGLSQAAATQVLAENWQRRRLTLHQTNQSISVSPGELGIVLDIPATVRNAHQHGRSQGTLLDALSPTRIAPVWFIDPAAVDAGLARLAVDFHVPAQDADLRIVDGQVQVMPAVPGQALDVAATRQNLVENLNTVIAEGRLPVTLKRVPPQRDDVRAARAAAEAMLDKSLTLQMYDPIRNETTRDIMPASTWSTWIEFSIDAGGNLQWRVQPERARQTLSAPHDALGPGRYIDTETALGQIETALQMPEPRITLRAYHHPQQHTVQTGETLSSIARDYGMPYPWLQEANPALDDRLVPGQNITVPSPDVMLPLPVVTHKRIVVSISSQRMWAYEYGNLVWEWPVSTGIASSPTSPGVFQIQSHEINAYASTWDLWMPHFMGIYRPVPSSGFMNGFHGFPTRDGHNLLWTGDLGRPVTYGCILLSNDNARTLFDWAEAGVVVEVRS